MGVNDFGRTPIRLPIRIQTTKGNRRVDAMLDTGNTIRTGAAMNAAYCQKIGLAWRRYKRKEPVGTAKRSSQLQVLGETEPFQIHILGLSGASGMHMVKAQVIEDLSQELNLGAKWLQQNNLSLHFSPRGARIEKALGGTVPLVSTIMEKDEALAENLEDALWRK